MLGAFRDFFQEVDGLRFEAWLGWIVRRNDHLDIDGNNEPSVLNEPCLCDSLAWNSHDSQLIVSGIRVVVPNFTQRRLRGRLPIAEVRLFLPLEQTPLGFFPRN